MSQRPLCVDSKFQLVNGMKKKALVIRPTIDIDKRRFLSGELDVCPDDRVVYRGIVFLYLSSSAGSLAVASALKKAGLETEYLDVACEYGIPLTKEKNEECLAKLAKRLQQKSYDLVGISCTAGNEYPTMLRIAEMAKKIKPECQVAVGGYHASALAEEIITKPGVDIVLKSDFEPVVKEFVGALNGSLQNLGHLPNAVCRNNSSIKNTSLKGIKVDMEETSLDYSLCEDYLSTYMIFNVEGSRGCPYKCRFCQERVMRCGHSMKSTSKTVAEIAESVKYICGHVTEPISLFFADPIWGLNRNWLHEFCDRMIERRVDLPKFLWGCLGRVGGYTAEDLAKMSQAGCGFISYGVESFSPRMLKMIDKTIDTRAYLEKVHNSFMASIEQDISVEANIIIGCPGETKETLNESEEYMASLYAELDGHNRGKKLSYEVRLFSPLPGTDLYSDLLEKRYAALGAEVVIDNWWEKGIFPYVCATFRPSNEVTTQMAAEALARLSNIAEDKLDLWEKSLIPEDIADKDIIAPADMRRIGSFHTVLKHISTFYNTGEEGEFETILNDGFRFCFSKPFNGRECSDEGGRWGYCEYYYPLDVAGERKKRDIMGLTIYWIAWEEDLNRELALKMCKKVAAEWIFTVSCHMEVIEIHSLSLKGYVAIIIDTHWSNPIDVTEGPLRFAVIHNTDQRRLYVLGIIVEQGGNREKEGKALRYIRDNILLTFQFT